MRGREGWLEIPTLLGIQRGMRIDRNVIEKTKKRRTRLNYPNNTVSRAPKLTEEATTTEPVPNHTKARRNSAWTNPLSATERMTAGSNRRPDQSPNTATFLFLHTLTMPNPHELCFAWPILAEWPKIGR
jgi:hypothetical protein